MTLFAPKRDCPKCRGTGKYVIHMAAGDLVRPSPAVIELVCDCPFPPRDEEGKPQ